LAKQILAASTEVWLPEVVAQVGERKETIAPAMSLRYRDVRTEAWLNGLRPDIIVSTDNRELLVEIQVTHACDETKVAKLRERDLAAIEIDLSGVNRLDQPAAHARQVLETAPRKWLHNAKEAAVEARLSAEADAKAADDARRMRWQHDKTAKEIAACWNDARTPDQAVWLRRTEDAGLKRYVGIQSPGENSFSVGTRTWQSAVLFCLVTRGHGQTFTLDGVLKYLQDRDMLKPPFALRRKWPPDMVACIRERIPDFKTPSAVLGGYAGVLASFGALHLRGPDRWQADEKVSTDASQSLQDSEQAASRHQEVSISLSAIQAVLGTEGRAFVETWWHRPCQRLGGVPRDLAIRGGWQWRGIANKIEAVAGMLRTGGPSLSDDDLLGFPLQQQRDERRGEEAERSARMEEARKDSTRRRGREFVAAFTGKAREHFGEVEGAEWARVALGELPPDFVDDARFDHGSSWRAGLESALAVEVGRRATERRDTARREAARLENEQVAASARANLEREVRMTFTEPDMANLWLRSTQHGLGMSPWSYCTDNRRLVACTELLKAVRLKRGR
jgi:hypothetical protein